MDVHTKELLIAYAISIILISFPSANIQTCFSTNSTGRIDLFTQKEPYSGKGPNVPSDAFGPGDLVVLYTFVTYSDMPVENLSVAFQVNTPSNSSFSLTGRTNSSGIATVDFRIPEPSQNINKNVFGYWHASADVLIDGMTFRDTLIFRVDWVIKLLSVRTIDANLTYKSHFGIGGDVGLEITLGSIAMTLRNASIAVVIRDELDVAVNFSTIKDFAVQPNEKLVFLYYKATLPKWAFVGRANATISALTAPDSNGGVPYCPSISTGFLITSESPSKIDYHDAAVVAVLPSARSIQVGQGLSLKTLVRNEGTVVQNFSVYTYFDRMLLRVSNVSTLQPYSTMSFNFTVNASQLTLGNHTISASIPSAPNEADLTDNYFADVIEVRPRLPAIIHDIAITDIKVSNTSVFIGEIVQIDVAVVNRGTEIETFDLSTYDNSSLIETRPVIAIEPTSQEVLTFTWDTVFVHQGSYQISAFAPLPGDPTPADNTLVDGVVHVKTKPYFPPPSFPLPSAIVWWVVFLTILVLIASLVLLLFLYCLRRRKRKPSRRICTVIVHPRI